MSMPGLPSYNQSTPTPTQVPSYSAEPPEYERRLAVAEAPRVRPRGSFSQTSRGGGNARLTLTAQEPGIDTPTYGVQGCVEGIVEMQRPDIVIGVEVKVEGRLKLREVAEDGSSSAKLCLNSQVLWPPRGVATPCCPSSLSFSMNLPTIFNCDGKNYPLPPTFDVKLSGLPGFTATIDYFISASIQRMPSAASPLVNSVKSNILKMSPGTTVIRIPFNYLPRTRPTVSLPPRLRLGQYGFHDTPDWQNHKSEINSKLGSGHSISTKLYLPSSRVFSISQQIPFHLTLEGNTRALAAFVPFGPTSSTGQSSRMGTGGGKSPMKIEIMRQSSVDSRNAFHAASRTEMWHTDTIGAGQFRHSGDGSTWASFSGEISIAQSVRVSGFKAHGLTVKDCILFSMIPYEPQKCPFWELRQVIPVQLTTDSWIPDGSGMGAERPEYKNTI